VKTARIWDIFCKVVDNYGDVGVCWRLAADLASRGQTVRLWIDQPEALEWMAPGALEGHWPRVEVRAWHELHNKATVPALAPADVWVEGFGCEVPVELQEITFHPAVAAGNDQNTGPVWINLEYLTAERVAERNHGLPSPLMHGPARGRTRFFFYPGFLPGTGGLLRETDLAQRRLDFDRTVWLASMGIAWDGEQLVSLFCYEPESLATLLDQLHGAANPTRLLVTHGRAAAAVGRVLDLPQNCFPDEVRTITKGSLSVTFLPPLSQIDFDNLLWSCDLNFVRGEDSVVRAIWAGKPFVWQIYPQSDDAHHAKLNAFLDVMEAPASWRAFHLNWNGVVKTAMPQMDLSGWDTAHIKARDKLIELPDLTQRLLEFVDHVEQASG